MRARSHAAPSGAGFTLVELMVVVAIMGAAVITAAIAFRGAGADKGAAFARSIVTGVQRARQNALASKTTTRVRLDRANKRFYVEMLDSTGTTWGQLGSALQAPAAIDLCDVASAPSLVAATPTCPATADTRVCFAASGRVTTTTTDVCPTSSAGTGATIYARAIRGTTVTKQYKVVIFGLTGMPKIMDTW